MSWRQLGRLIKEDELSVHSEERVFEAVMAWVKYDVDGRQVSSELEGWNQGVGGCIEHPPSPIQNLYSVI